MHTVKWELIEGVLFDENTVRMYERRIRDGKKLPAVVLRDDNGRYQVIDGFHRLEAMRRCGLKEIVGVYVVRTTADKVPDMRLQLNQHSGACKGQGCNCASERLSEALHEAGFSMPPVVEGVLDHLEPDCFYIFANPPYGSWRRGHRRSLEGGQ